MEGFFRLDNSSSSSILYKAHLSDQYNFLLIGKRWRIDKPIEQPFTGTSQGYTDSSCAGECGSIGNGPVAILRGFLSANGVCRLDTKGWIHRTVSRM